MTTVELLSNWLNCSADWMTTVGEDIVAVELGEADHKFDEEEVGC